MILSRKYKFAPFKFFLTVDNNWIKVDIYWCTDIIILRYVTNSSSAWNWIFNETENIFCFSQHQSYEHRSVPYSQLKDGNWYGKGREVEFENFIIPYWRVERSVLNCGASNSILLVEEYKEGWLNYTIL